MNTYQLIAVAAIKLGIPTILTYLAFKASAATSVLPGAAGIDIVIAALTFVVATIITHVTMENELKYFN